VAAGEPNGERRPIAIPPPGVAAAPAPTSATPRERRGGFGPASLLLTLFVAYLLYQVQLLLILTLLAVVFATAIERPVHLLETRRLPRPVGILVVYAAILGGLVLFFSVLAPVIQDQVAIFREQAPDQLLQLQAAWAASPNALLNGPGQDLLRQGIEVVANPDDIEAMLLLANLLGNSDRLTEAIPWYERVLAARPTDIVARLDFARALADGGLTSDAELQFVRAIEIDPRSQDAHYYLAELYQNSVPSRQAEAAREFGEARAIDPATYLGQQADRALTQLGVGQAAGSPSPIATPEAIGTP